MRHGDLSGDRFEQVVVVAVATTGLVADLEAVGQGLEDPHHLVDGANLGAADDLPGLAEDTDRDALVVDIETDVEHGCLLKSIDIGTAATVFQVTRLTEASLHSLNTDARREARRRFGRSHRRAQRSSLRNTSSGMLDNTAGRCRRTWR